VERSSWTAVTLRRWQCHNCIAAPPQGAGRLRSENEPPFEDSDAITGRDSRVSLQKQLPCEFPAATRGLPEPWMLADSYGFAHYRYGAAVRDRILLLPRYPGALEPRIQIFGTPSCTLRGASCRARLG
jgi:hypothetical protein